MSLLFFWKGTNYYRDMNIFGKSYELNQNNELMNRVGRGEHIWAFTRRKDKTYVLALDLSVIGKSRNTPQAQGYKYGVYHVEGDRRKSRYFNTAKGADVEPIIRSLSVTINAKTLGHSFQGERAVKQLTASDDVMLMNFASNLMTI